MPIESADGRVAEQDAAATIGLEAVLVRVDDDRIRLADPVEGRAGLGPRLPARVKYPPYAVSTWMRKSYRSRKARTSGSGSTVPAAVVPSVTTTVPTSPSARIVLEVRDLHPPSGSTETFRKGTPRTAESRECV